MDKLNYILNLLHKIETPGKLTTIKPYTYAKAFNAAPKLLHEQNFQHGQPTNYYLLATDNKHEGKYYSTRTGPGHIEKIKIDCDAFMRIQRLYTPQKNAVESKECGCGH